MKITTNGITVELNTDATYTVTYPWGQEVYTKNFATYDLAADFIWNVTDRETGDAVLAAMKEAFRSEPTKEATKAKNTYIAIGHEHGKKDCTTCVAICQSSIKAFRADLRGWFVPVVVITEKKLHEMIAGKESADPLELLNMVKGLNSNYRVWNHICEFVKQCDDIMLEKIEDAKARQAELDAEDEAYWASR